MNRARSGDSPDLSPQARASCVAMERVFGTDLALPFLEINDNELAIDGQPRQVYTLQPTTDLVEWRSLGQTTNQTARLICPLANRLTRSPQQFFCLKVENDGK